jgi:O-antigen ligase
MNNLKLNPYSTIASLSIFWISGFFFFPTGQSHNQAFIVLFVLPAIWLILKLKISFKPFFKSKIFWIAFLFCSYYAISTSWGTYSKTSLLISEIKRSLYLYLFWVVIFISYYIDRPKLILLTKYTVFFALISVFYNAIIFYGVDHHSISDRFNGFGRLRNQLWVGALYGSMALLMLILTLQPNNQKRYLCFIIFTIFFIATLLTHSRGPILSMLAVSALILFSGQLSVKSKIKISAIILLTTSISAIYLSKYYLADITRGQSYRLDLWLGFLKFTKDHLFLGHGAGVNVFIVAPGQFVNGWSHYHNIYLGTLIELGLIGLTLHLLLVISTVLVGWRYRTCLHVNVALMIFIFTCLIGITYGQGIITRINAQWIIFWLPLAVIIMRELEENGVKKPLIIQN